ncbi:MAG: penicillin acylase family protein [Flavobacteriales bacterium]
MRLFKKFLKVFFLFLLLVIVFLFWYQYNQKPTYSGTLQLEHLSAETKVYFDEYGIPHIYAENQQDALTTLGYVHAQDRLWQMELLRRIAPGRLSEIFGSKLLKNDKLFVSLQIEENSIKSIQSLDTNSESYRLTKAYLDGINQYIEKGKTPIEYTLVGIEKEPFTLKDVYNIMGYMSFSFAMAHKTDPLLTILKEKLGTDYIKELGIDIDPASTLIKTFQSKTDSYKKILANASKLFTNQIIPAFEGSNSWVIGPKKTKNGKVIFANDPHIGFSQPAVWYEAHINTPDYEMYGYHLAGIPFPLLGHNREYAYGLTMFENDDIDFYEEKKHPTDNSKYKTATGYADFKIIHKTIKVKDSNDVELTLKSSQHGPIINDVVNGIPEKSPIAMSWIYTKLENKTMDAFYNISRATSMKDVKKGASLIHAPGLNVMYGDAKGNIAWWASAKLYQLKSKANRKFILDGNTSENDSIKYLDFDKNPMAENPEWNYVYSANNQPDSIAGSLYPGYYIAEDRAKRIVNLLESSNSWTQDKVGTMINDVTSSVSGDVIKTFISEMDVGSFSKNEQQAIDILQLWDGSNTTDAIAPTIYNKWIYMYLKNTFEDEMGSLLFQQFMATHLSKRVIASQIEKKNSIWWDNVNTKEVETRKTILTESLKQTVATLEKQLGKNRTGWNWGKVQTVTHPHPLGTVDLLNQIIGFNVGPFPINGAREVINNRGYTLNETGVYNVKSGPSTRRIIDFSNAENSMSILPTGQSGNPFSAHYNDQAQMFLNGNFRKMLINKEEIEATSTKLIFTPEK